MTAAHIHLLLTHIPVLGTLFGLLVLAYGRFRPSVETIRIGLGLFVLSGLAAVAVYLTGEGAEEIVEHMAGVSHDIIEQHEEAAFVALLASGFLGIVSAAGLLASRRLTLATWFANSVLVLAIVITGIMAWTANLGGQINHPEIRPDGASIGTEDSAHRTGYDDQSATEYRP